MSFFEILFRFRQLFQKYYEKAFLIGSQKKVTHCDIHSKPFDVKDISGFKIKYEIEIFGKNFNYRQEEIDWHLDIFSNKSFSLDFAKSINIRSNKDLSAKAVWEVNRMQFLTLIAINYKTKKDENDLVLFTRLVDSWIEQNPYLKGVNWYSNIEVNIRLIVWYFCWNILDVDEIVKTNEYFKEFVQRWIATIYQHCIYSYKNPSKYSSSNNHLISEYAGLFIASSLWKFPESEHWSKYSKKGLEKEIVRQHTSNGINREEAAEYIQFITDFFLLAYVAGSRSENNFSTNYKETLKKIIDYINNFLDVNGNFPKYGDEDDGKCILFTEDPKFNNFRSLINSGAILSDDESFNVDSNLFDIKSKVLFGSEIFNKKVQYNKQSKQLATKFYDEDGHFIFRHYINGKEIYCHFDAAPLGFLSIAAHGHADALSFVLHVDGQPFFIDSGTYTYHTEYDWRKYFMGTLAHNTVRVNKKDQSDITGPTMWSNHFQPKIHEAITSESIDRVVASHNGYRDQGIQHVREFVFNKDKNIIQIIDTLKCKKEGDYLIEIPFHLHPEIKVTEQSQVILLNDNSDNNIRLKVDKDLELNIVKGQVKPEILGWYSDSFMKKVPSSSIYCKANVSGTKKFKSEIQLN